MIKANLNEDFPILVSLFDEETQSLSSGQQVDYDIRYLDDTALYPPISGTLAESTIEHGLYKTALSIPEPGIFICYATCSGFISSTEEIIIEELNVYELVNNNHHYNISVENVIREGVAPNPSQTSRNVALNDTDYVITRIKADSSLDWTDPVASGIVYAHYRTNDTTIPYMMGGPF